jgi:hypothetical protein
MRDDDDRHLPLERIDTVLNMLLGGGVQVARGLVQQQQIRLLKELPCHEQALLLSAGKPNSTVADLRLIPVRQVFNEVVGVGPFGGVNDPLAQGRVLLNVALPEANVVGHGIVEHDRLL